MDSVSHQGDQLPPFAPEAERALLGECLMTPAQSMGECLNRFGEDEVFYELTHLEIWRAMVFVWQKEHALDLVGLVNELRARGLLDQVGGMAYVSGLADAAVPGSVGRYVDIVWEKYVARRLIQKNSSQVRTVMEYNGAPSEAFIAQVEQDHVAWKQLLDRGTVTPRNLSKPSDFDERVYEQFFERKENEYGYALPFEYVLRLRPGETTLFTGDNGSGKTSMLSLMAIVVAKQLQEGETVVVASMEMLPEVTLWIMVRQLLGENLRERTAENITKLVQALAWLNKRVRLYNYWGITDKKDLMNTFRFAADQHQGKFFIIDNMMKVGIADDDYAAQGYFIQEVCDFSMHRKVHTVVVVHENKGDGSTKQKVRGSKQLTDAPNNLVKMERNEKKAQKLEDLKAELAAGTMSQDEYNRALEGQRKVWDSKFTHGKQRCPGTAQNGSKWLYFDRESLQFHEKPGMGAINYLI